MPPWPPITRDDLKDAAGHAGFDTTFPLLVRRLIAETADGLEELDMPGGSGVATGGFDGVAVCTGQTLDVPAGKSVWELSVDRKAGAKADDDYEKRLTGPVGESPAEIVYVQVILAPWTGARMWAERRTAEGRWSEVRALNLDALHSWLDRAPATTAWLAEQLGKTMHGVRAADDWLTRTWLPSTTTPLDVEYILAGRDKSAASLLSTLASGKVIVTVAGDLTVDEFKAVVAASVTRADSPIRDTLQARTLLVDDGASLAQLVAQRQSVVLVLADARLAAQLPAGHGHQLIVRAPHDSAADIIIEPVDAQVVRDLLRRAGETWERAGQLGTLARRSLSGLRRLLAGNPASLRPSWADDPGALRRRLLLLGSWEGSNPVDRAVVEEVTGRAYTEVEDAALVLARAEDTPMLGCWDEQWHLLATEDAWMLLQGQLARGDLDALAAAAGTVLTDTDPFYGMDHTTRVMSQTMGQRRTYSRALRRGLATSLALIGSAESQLPAASSTIGSDLARRPVQEILAAANSDSSYTLWSALRDVVGLLAEAAPEEFLEAMRDGLQGTDPLHARMFTDSADADALFGSPASHSEFLWALEILAWLPEYFDDAVDLLARLAEVDPGGRYSNRPHQSLVDILSCWHPTTAASDEQRFAALRRLLRVSPEITRRLLIALIPDGGETQVSRPGPRFRAAKAERNLTPAQIAHCTGVVVDLLLEDLQGRPERYAALIGKFEYLSSADRDCFVDALKELGEVLDDDSARAILHDALLRKTTHHREYADAWWALPGDALGPLEDATAHLAPRTARLAVAWLFTSDWIPLGDPSRREDLVAYDCAVLERRAEAVGRVLAEEGLDGIAALAEGTEYPYLVGAGLAAHTHSYDQQLLSWLGQDRARHEVSYAYLRQRLRDEGADLLDVLLDVADSAEAKAALLRAIREPEAAWSRLANHDEAVTQAYWRGFKPYGLGTDFGAAQQAAQGLLVADRYAAALHLVSLYSDRTNTTEIAQTAASACEGLLAAQAPDPELNILSSYDYGRIVSLLHNHVDAIGMQRIITIEWQLFPGLGFEPQSPALHSTLGTDPAFFAELVCYIYRSEDATNEAAGEELDQTRLAIARRAYEVLHSWRRCPGTGPDGQVDREALGAWVTSARTVLHERHRTMSGDNEIGRIIAHAAPDADNTYPPVAVRDLLEEIGSDRLDEGVEIEIFNKRGVTTRGMYDGGDQERALSATYRTAAAQAGAWPRTRRMLRRLASSFDREARRHDEDAERRRRGLD